MQLPKPTQTSRRTFLSRSTASVGAMALGTMLKDVAAKADAGRGIVFPPHVRPRAKRIIHLYMAGGPSHLETFDFKPKLVQMHGKPMPDSLTKGQQIAQLQGQKLNCFAPQWPFSHYGQSGQQICTKFSKIGTLADDICIIRSMQTGQINHDPAHTQFNTGDAVTGRPSIGAWLTYGLGESSRDLPSYVVMTSIGKGGQAQPIASRQWSAGFLPSRFQGVEFRSTGDPVLYLSNPPGITPTMQRDTIDAVSALNRKHFEIYDDPEALTRIAQYELAYRMQMSVPELLDTSSEPQHVLDMYGTKGGDGTFASNCLMARRLAERGVRFIQVYHRAWDHHGGIKRAIDITAKEVDQPAWALITDLKQRGMLDDTLVMFGGEFGRTPMAQGNGRDHHIKGYSYMLAGGGIQGGNSYGNTDEFGYNAVENIVPLRHLHATLLHLMGIDHQQLTYEFQGLQVKLTGVEEAHVLQPILA